MNVNDYIDNIQVPDFTEEVALEMVKLRHKVFLGFASIEKEKGFVTPAVSFSTSKGQEMLRIMLFRVMEEVLESHHSKDKFHYQEELIDALNYFMSALMIDEELFSEKIMASILFSDLGRRKWLFYDVNLLESKTPPTEEDVYIVADVIFNQLAETFRNRAWMSQTQQTFFHGFTHALNAFETFLSMMITHFDSWENFYKMYMAKHKVLEFRLQSKY